VSPSKIIPRNLGSGNPDQIQHLTGLLFSLERVDAEDKGITKHGTLGGSQNHTIVILRTDRLGGAAQLFANDSPDFFAPLRPTASKELPAATRDDPRF